ncbi:hypothetical protein ACMZ6Z_04805 [Streptococcus pluranimalium]|uniref:hypothetical protein n=1 Tax=Streptococcus pluranimalium TaxID=82348 RepID=UPI0039FCBEAB
MVLQLEKVFRNHNHPPPPPKKKALTALVVYFKEVTSFKKYLLLFELAEKAIKTMIFSVNSTKSNRPITKSNEKHSKVWLDSGMFFYLQLF